MGLYSNTTETSELPYDSIHKAAYSPSVVKRKQHTGAFVIQFQTDTDLTAELFEGRVEHVASGELTHFYSRNELLAFLDRMMKTTPISGNPQVPVSEDLETTLPLPKGDKN